MDIKPVRCRIPEILKRKRKTQVWLATQVGMSKQQLNDYVHLRIIMKIDTAVKIAHVLDVSPEDLYEWEWVGE